MFSRIMIGTDDIDTARAFHDAVPGAPGAGEALVQARTIACQP